MTIVAFVISGLLLGAMLGISCYGAVPLFSDARIPRGKPTLLGQAGAGKVA